MTMNYQDTNILSKTQNEYSAFLQLWFIIHLFPEIINLNDETGDQAVSKIFGNMVSRSISGNRLIGISCNKFNTCKLLKKDNIPLEIINEIKNLPAFESDGEFSTIWEDTRGIACLIKKITTSTCNEDYLSITHDTKKLTELMLNRKYLGSLNLPDTTEYYLSWLRALNLFTKTQDAFSNNQAEITKKLLVITPLQWIDIILTALEIEYNRIPPSAILALTDWVTYDSTKTPTIVLDNLNLIQFVATSISRTNAVNIYSNIKENKEKLALILILKIFRTLSEAYGATWHSYSVNKINPNFPVIGEKTALSDFCRSKDIKGSFKSRKILILNSNCFDDIYSDLDLNNNSQASLKLSFSKSILKVDCLTRNSHWNIFLYDDHCVGKTIGYSSFSGLNNGVSGCNGKLLDLNTAQANSFQSAVKYFHWSQFQFSRSVFPKLISHLSDIDKIIKTNGAREIDPEEFFSGKPVFWGSLNDFVHITRGQVLKTKEDLLSVGYEINPGDISESGLVNSPKKIITNIDKKGNEKYKIQKGDILIGVKGLVGVVGFIDHDVNNWYAGQAIAILRRKENSEHSNDLNKNTSSEYIFLNLKSKQSQDNIKRLCMSGKSKSIDMSKLRSLLISLPEVSMDAYREKCKKLFESWREFQNQKSSVEHLTVFDNQLNLLSMRTPEFQKKYPKTYKNIDEEINKLLT